MVKCPECGEDIDHVEVAMSCVQTSIFDGTDHTDYEFNSDGRTVEYSCPDCYKLLFVDEEAAKEFLEGKAQEVGTEDGEVM